MAVAPLRDEEQEREYLAALMAADELAGLALVPRPRWMAQGACRWRPEIDFFASSGNQERAKAVCRTCPVAEECLAYALERYETEGIWGGKTPVERRELIPRRGPGRPRKQPLRVVVESR
jgi:hypothetical protein